VGMFLMWGYPGEQIDDIAATVDLVKRAEPDIHLTTVAYPIKNTGFFDKVADAVTTGKQWADATDRDYRIRGRLSRGYYKQADQWLNNEVAASRIERDDPAGAEQRRALAARARQAMLAGHWDMEA
jgi:anaerobic magnesium-protoporphyrin IX monomethyl ester cyclase